MSRAATGNTVVVKPTNNIYTALVIVATVVSVMGLIAVVMQANSLVGGLF